MVDAGCEDSDFLPHAGATARARAATRRRALRIAGPLCKQGATACSKQRASSALVTHPLRAWDEMQVHMAKEEQVLFPRYGAARTARAS